MIEDTSLAIRFFLFKLLRNYACFGGGLDVSGRYESKKVCSELTDKESLNTVSRLNLEDTMYGDEDEGSTRC